MACGDAAHMLGCRVIGEVYSRYARWGIELYVQEGTIERPYGRWLSLSDDPAPLMAFCRRINMGRVSPLHAQDVWRDFLDSQLVSGEIKAEDEVR